MADEPLAEEQEPETDPTEEPTEAPDEEPEADDDAAEQEEEGTSPAEEPAPEAQAQLPPPPATEKEAEKRTKAWNGERDKHMGALEKADAHRYALSSVCPFCEGHGLMFTPTSPEEQEQLRTFVLAVVGERTPEELHKHPTYHVCEVCEGYGKVATGSKVVGQETLNCPECNGQGHTGGRSNVAVIAAAPPPGVPPEAVPITEQERIGPDAWGRPPGHPHYAKLPAEVG